MACAICGEKYSFKDSKTLLDVDYLRKQLIAYCLQWKHTHRQITTAVNQLEAANNIAGTDKNIPDDILLLRSIEWRINHTFRNAAYNLRVHL